MCCGVAISMAVVWGPTPRGHHFKNIACCSHLRSFSSLPSAMRQVNQGTVRARRIATNSYSEEQAKQRKIGGTSAIRSAIKEIVYNLFSEEGASHNAGGKMHAPSLPYRGKSEPRLRSGANRRRLPGVARSPARRRVSAQKAATSVRTAAHP